MLNLCQSKLSHSQQSRPRADLVSEGLSYLRSCKGKFPAVELEQAFEVDEYALSSLGSQVT